MELFYDRYIRDCKYLSFDIETSGDQITCIGFSPDPSVALVIPFTIGARAIRSYWPSLEAELSAWNFVERCLSHPSQKVAQNGLYDIHFLWRRYGIAVKNFEHDTMLLHHSLQPEASKGLDFLGSIYTNEASWKLMRTRGKQTIKRDE
jgi:DNA polymerase I-like protein with 3'-5' exonuclease and polymerase domains